MEDGVGNTPLEIAAFNWLRASTGDSFRGTLPTIQLFNEGMLHLYRNMDPQPITRVEMKELKGTLDRLIASGRLQKGTKLATDLAAFANKKESEAKKRVESDFPNERVSRTEEADGVHNKDIIEGTDAIKTMEYITGVVGARCSARQLVHLVDVHRSVQGSLDRSVYKPYGCDNNYDDYRNRYVEGPEHDCIENKQEEASLRKHSAVSWWHNQYVFGLFEEDNI